MSTGILTCLPSTTPFGLALGPDSPPTDEPCRGTLRFSGHWILTNVFVTQADILTTAMSTKTRVIASPLAVRSPTDLFFYKSHSFGRLLSPGHCRRKNALPVSYYALFQGIAASTSAFYIKRICKINLSSEAPPAPAPAPLGQGQGQGRSHSSNFVFSSKTIALISQHHRQNCLLFCLLYQDSFPISIEEICNTCSSLFEKKDLYTT